MSERTIIKLKEHHETVFVYLRTKELAKLFLRQASEKGLTWWDGSDPQKNPVCNIYEIQSNFTINYLYGFHPHLSFYTAVSRHGEGGSIAVDFEKYRSGDPNYIITDTSQLEIPKCVCFDELCSHEMQKTDK